MYVGLVLGLDHINSVQRCFHQQTGGLVVKATDYKVLSPSSILVKVILAVERGSLLIIQCQVKEQIKVNKFPIVFTNEQVLYWLKLPTTMYGDGARFS